MNNMNDTNHTSKINLLIFQMEYAWNIVTRSISNISDDEFWWKPTNNAWTLREQNRKWILDYDIPIKIPIGPLTNAWLILHLASCKIMYFEYAFGDSKLDWDDIQYPSTVNDALSYLINSHPPLLSKLNDLTDQDLEIIVSTNWGEKWSIEKIYWTLIQHDIYHGAQIQQLRKIYQNRNFRFSS